MPDSGHFTTSPTSPHPVKVLFVCMGNICRSPSAEGVLRYKVETSDFKGRVLIASAGTHGYHIGNPADERSCQAAQARGVDLSRHRARQLQREDFEHFDYILVMDERNHHHASKICPPGGADKLHYLMDFAPQLNTREVPDPYYGGPQGFEHVLDLIEAACAGLLADIRERHLDPHGQHRDVNG